MPSASQFFRRLVGLDVLRAAAILLVLGHHPPAGPPDQTSHPLLALWFRVGWVGVDLFFVLSGFLIGGLLFAEAQRTGAIRLRRFWIRRGFKILPQYYAFLVAVALLWLHDGQPSIRGLWPNLLHIQNYTGTRTFTLWHTWSLSVEEHFYLLLPVTLAVLGSTRRNWLPILFTVVALGCLILRIRAAGLVLIPERNHAPTHLRIDSLLFGVILAYAWMFSPRFVGLAIKHRSWLLITSGLCFLPALLCDLHDSPFLYTYGFSLLWLGSGCVLIWARVGDEQLTRGSMPVRLFAGVGACSYGIYLWHMPFAHRLALSAGHHWKLSEVQVFVLYLITAVLLGVVLTRAIERPALALRDRLTM